MNPKKIYVCLLVILLSSAAISQKNYFIYIQSENKQPFSVKLSEKVYNSTSNGYVIIPKLIDSTYSFSIGNFGNNSTPSFFSVTINKKDHGYLLKNFEGKGSGLFNLQTLELKMSTNALSSAESNTSVKDVPAFTEGLSKAAGDPSLKDRPATPKPAPKPPVIIESKPSETNIPPPTPTASTSPVIEEKKETPIVEPAKKNEESKPIETPKEVSTVKIEPLQEVTTPKPIETVTTTPEIKKETNNTIEETSYQPSTIKKKSESSTTEGFGLTYIDSHPNGTNDTIKLLIPNPKTPQAVITTQETIPAADTKVRCMLVAGDADFLELRKQMAAATGDEGMINEAKKSFAKFCFSTLQVKNLSTLFLTDEGKYRFFDAAYDYTSDTSNFPSLETELKDEYYIKRFKALLRN